MLTRLEPAAREAVESFGLTYLCDLRGITEREISKLPAVDARAKDMIRTAMKEHGRIWGEGGKHNG